MQDFLQALLNPLGISLVNLLVALVILVVGWLIALLLRAGTRKLLARTNLDNRMAQSVVGEDTAGKLNLENLIGQIVFWIVMLIVFVAFFDRLNLPAISGTLKIVTDAIVGAIPRIIAGSIAIFIAWLLATIVRFLIKGLFGKTKLDENLAEQADVETGADISVTDTLADAVYWFVWLLFLPAILGAFGVQSLLGPVQNMVDQFLSFLPNILGAVAIGFIGWVVARVVRKIVESLLAAAGVDRFGERAGFDAATGGQTLSKLVGTLVYALILITVIIAALDTLNIAAISDPATAMLLKVMDAIPNVIGAVIVIAIAYFVAKLIGDLVASILTGLGFDKVLQMIGLGSEAKEGQMTPSKFVGWIVVVLIMLFAVSGAAELLGFATLTGIVIVLLGFMSKVLLGIVIFGLGLYLAKLTYAFLTVTAGKNAHILAVLARVAIIIFAGALALSATGVSPEIVTLAFGSLMIALAAAAALAFGLGSRETAGHLVDEWVGQLKDGSDDGN